MKAGVAISPDTPSTAITSEIGNLADMLLVMTVYPGSLARSYGYTLRLKAGLPGKGGQKFLDRCVPKVSELRARFPDKDIEVDGGVGPKTIGVCADAGMSMSRKTSGREKSDIPVIPHKGSNVIVAGTAVFGAEDPEKVITTLKSTVNQIQDKIAAGI